MAPAAPTTELTEDRPLWRRVLRWVLWVGLALIFVLGAIALWAWTQRYSLIERQVITYLDSQGIDADLRIRNATRTEADIRDIRLAYDGEPFLKLDRLEADYQWRDLLDGKVERLAFTGLDATVTIDADGQIVDGWRPPSGGGGGLTLPPRGITVRRGALRLKTPWGDVPLRGDADIASLEQVSFSGRLEPTRLRWQEAEIALGGPVEAQRDGALIDAEMPELALSLSHPQGELLDTRAALSGAYDFSERSASGQAVMRGGTFTAAAGLQGGIERLDVDGRFARDTGLQATVAPTLRAVSVTDPDRRRDLAQTLSLATALADVPVARNFAPQLVAPLERLLSGADVSGRLRADLAPDGRLLSLLEPLMLTREATTLTLTPASDAPLYRYPAGSDRYFVAAEANLNRPLPLRLIPLKVAVLSDNGLSVGGVASADGRVRTGARWSGRSPDGVPAALGPLDVRFDYTNPGDRPAALTLRGAADYSGDVPGGIVTDLQAGGRLDATLRENRPSVRFAPSGPLRFAELETTSDWGLRDFTGTLVPSGPVYARAANGTAQVETGLKDAQFTAQRKAEAEGGPASLAMTVGDAALSGVVREITQDWDVTFGASTLKSDSFPVEGTDLTLPSGALTVALSADDRTGFTLSAPDSTLVTPAYTVRGMALDAAGTAERYTLDFAGGRVRMAAKESGVPFPVMPADGVLRFEDGVFTGEAQSSLPRADEQPFAITYRIEDGRGEADVTIRDLIFAPRKLQPQDLVPALRGKISLVEGAIDADLDVRFGGDAPPSGTGTIQMKDLALGTAPGPVSGLSGTVTLTSLFPVVTASDQEVTIALFDPGFPLRDGVLRYALVDDGVAVGRAVWPLGEGRVAIDPFLWRYGADENRVVLRVSGVDVGEFLKDIGDGRLDVTGELSGAIPVVVRGIDVLVEGGRLEVPDGGFIRYTPKEGAGIAERVDNRFAAEALKALENFRYEELFAEINGPLGGEIKLGMEFEGKNPDVLYGVPFAFDISVEGELFNIARSLNTNATIKRTVGPGVTVAE